MNILNLPGLSGVPSLILTIFALIVGGWYITKIAKSSAETSIRDAQKSAMDAMQAEMTVLRNRMEDEQKENARKLQLIQKKNIRLEQTIDTICTALEKKGIYITINGDMIDIEVKDTKKSTTIMIKDASDDDCNS